MGLTQSYDAENKKLKKQINQLQSDLDGVKGPCPDDYPVFLPFEENEYFCYQQKSVDELHQFPDLVCSMFKENETIDPKFKKYLPNGGDYGTNQNKCKFSLNKQDSSSSGNKK